MSLADGVSRMIGLMLVDASLRRFAFRLTTTVWADATPEIAIIAAIDRANLKNKSVRNRPPGAASIFYANEQTPLNHLSFVCITALAR